MRLTYLAPENANVVEVATAVLAATRELVGTDAEVFGQRDGNRTLLVLQVPDATNRADVVALVAAETGLVPRPDGDQGLAADTGGDEA